MLKVTREGIIPTESPEDTLDNRQSHETLLIYQYAESTCVDQTTYHNQVEGSSL